MHMVHIRVCNHTSAVYGTLQPGDGPRTEFILTNQKSFSKLSSVDQFMYQYWVAGNTWARRSSPSSKPHLSLGHTITWGMYLKQILSYLAKNLLSNLALLVWSLYRNWVVGNTWAQGSSPSIRIFIIHCRTASLNVVEVYL